MNDTDNDFHSNPNSTLSQDLDSPSFKFVNEKINNENIQHELNTYTSSFELSSQTKLKHVSNIILIIKIIFILYVRNQNHYGKLN